MSDIDRFHIAVVLASIALVILLWQAWQVRRNGEESDDLDDD